jgi:plasmid maintenance system antidote protein VapI
MDNNTDEFATILVKMKYTNNNLINNKIYFGYFFPNYFRTSTHTIQIALYKKFSTLNKAQINKFINNSLKKSVIVIEKLLFVLENNYEFMLNKQNSIKLINDKKLDNNFINELKNGNRTDNRKYIISVLNIILSKLPFNHNGTIANKIILINVLKTCREKIKYYHHLTLHRSNHLQYLR